MPAINTETIGTIYNVTVVTGAGTSATSTASQWYWFGSGSCTFSGTGVQNSGAPPGASAYIQGAVAGTSGTNPSGGTVIPTACTGLSGLGTTAPMIESLSERHGGQRHGDRPGRQRRQRELARLVGLERLLGHDELDLQRPRAGLPAARVGAEHDRVAARSRRRCARRRRPEGRRCTTAPTRTRPAHRRRPRPTPGFVDCSLAALTAKSGTPPDTYIAATLQISYATDPTPDPATATFSPSTVAPGNTVTLNSCSTCNWWGAGSEGSPSFVPPIGPAPASATAVPAPAVWVGTTRASAVEAATSTNTVAITPAGYDCGSSGGAATTSPGPVATCTLSQGTISGSFVMPSVTCSPCNIYVDEPNLTLTQSTYAAHGGTGTYNNGLSYQLVNSVESATTISCPTCSGGGTAPTVTAVSPTSGPTAGATSVTITGTNFTGATAVHFGANAATGVVVNNATSHHGHVAGRHRDGRRHGDHPEWDLGGQPAG